MLKSWLRLWLLLILSPVQSQDANFNVELVDVGDGNIFCTVTTAVEALPGSVWLYVTALGQEPTTSEVKSGVGALGLSSCSDLGDLISAEVVTLGLTACGLTLGQSYSLQVLFEGNGSRLIRQNFTVPPEPSPLPIGPYCFDIDYDYAGATVLRSAAGVADAVACQALCVSSSACLHFRFTYDASLPNYQVCDLLSSGPVSASASPAAGIIAGPSDCETRAVLYFRPRGNLFRTQPTPIVRGIPVTIFVQGEYFDPSYDRIVAVDAGYLCGAALPSLPGGGYAVKGTMPNSWDSWRQLPCNDTGSAPELMICGANAVVFDELGPVRFCACDAGALPFGCAAGLGDFAHFSTLVTLDVLDVTGPFTNNSADCPASRECTVTGLQGYGMSAGDKLMLRENCTQDPTVISYTGPSRPSPDPAQGQGATYLFEDLNTATCPDNHTQGPCLTARLCYCAAALGSTHSCLVDSDFLVDAGEVRFFGAPGIIDGLVILQEDHESFTLRWNYPADDGGGEVTHYNLFFRLCPGGNYTDGVETEYIVPLLPGENRWGTAFNATYHFREPVVDAIPQPILPATRYCIVVLATNGAATGRRDVAQEFVWLTDVSPPKDLWYPDALYMVKDMPMTPMVPSVTTADCRSLPSVANTIPQLAAQDCQVQNYDIQPPLPTGMILHPLSGIISGTPTALQPRPEIYLITATNAGGKTSAYITIAVIGQIRDSTLSTCVTAPMTGELVLSFRTPSITEAPNLQVSSSHPQSLRLRLLKPLLLTLLRSTGDALGDVPRSSAIGCGALVLDVSSDSPQGFPPPTLCHWEDSKDLQLGAAAVGARTDMLFQGDATFENDAIYQMVLKVGFSTMVANQELLQMTFYASESSSAEQSVDSDAFGAWTTLEQLPQASPRLEQRKVVLLPQEDAPWFTGRPHYVPGFSNPLLGEAPDGLPYPEGFPAPGPRTCYNFSSYCPTSPHQYVNTPYATAWYLDVGTESALFPFFAIFEGTAVLLQDIQSPMLFNPFGSYSLTGVNSFSLTDRFLTNLMSFQLEFSLSPDISGGLTFEQFITACPSSPLRTPLMSLSPVCSVQSGPSFVTCTCESSLPTNHQLVRCDRLRIRVNAGGDIRATITATLRLFAPQEWWPGYQPIQWYVQLKSQFGGLSSYRKVANAGFTVWQDFLMVQTTPELCADECLSRLSNSPPCNSFKYHRVDQDCYLSSYVESTSSPLRTDWPGDVYDYYEYQEQVAYALPTVDVLVFSGVFFSALELKADTFLEPPEPSPPSFDVAHFFPSYVDQSWLRFRIQLMLVVPIHGQSSWASLDFVPPDGFIAIALSAVALVPTALGRGYCGVGTRCRWLLAEGQALWPGWNYTFDVTMRNPSQPHVIGEPWTFQVSSPGFVAGPSYSSAAVSVPHPLPVDGHLLGCGVHFNDAKYQLHSANSSLDLFFVLANNWVAGAALRLRLPQAFELPLACHAQPLTPWLRPEEVVCSPVGNTIVVNFTAPLPLHAAVGLRLWPFFLSQPVSSPLNIRLESVEQQAADATDACHPAVWSCGLYPPGEEALAIGPSAEAFAFFRVQLSHLERRRNAWAILHFAVNRTLVFHGLPQDVLKIRPPYGFSILDVHSSSLQALRRREQSGQLNLAEVVDIPTAIETSRTFLVDLMAGGDGSSMQALRVTNLHGSIEAQQQQFVNLSLTYPESGVEPSLFDVLSRAPNESACANVWGVSFETKAEDSEATVSLASAFAKGQTLAVLEQLTVECNTRAASAKSALSIRFRTTPRALPSFLPGESLVIAFRFSQEFEMTEPSPVAEYAAPFMRSTNNGLELERQSFQKLGCPPMPLYSFGRRLQQELPGCAVFLNDFQSTIEVFFNASGVVAGANEVLLRVRNPPRTGPAPNVTVMAYRTDGIPFRLVPAPLVLAESQRALVLLQEPLTTVPCEDILPAMEAEVFTGSCLLPGLANEVTLGFIAPQVLQAPVAATLRAPMGFRIAWDCNFEATQLLLPGGRTLEFLLAGFFTGCVVNSDGRSISFNITRNIKAVTSWTFFTIHSVNPAADELPATADQSAWSLEVGGFAAAGAMELRLRTFQAELMELPHEYNATTRPVLLTFTSFSAVPTGGYVVVTAPEGVHFPEQCDTAVANLPVLSTQPFRALGTTPELSSSCEVAGSTLRIAVLQGSLPAGLYELRFIITKNVNLNEGALKWGLDSWAPQSCSSCCVRRPHFRSIVGLDTIELLDTAVFYATLPGMMP